MSVTEWCNVPPHSRGAAVALGNFDGVHRGHVHLLETLHGARPDLPLGVVTFEPHPREFFRPQDPPMRLMVPDVRARFLRRHHVSHIFQMSFNEAFSHINPRSFVDDILCDGLGVKHVACGPDFAFGHRRTGDVPMLGQWLEARGVGLTIVDPMADRGGPLSSSRIRRLLREGYPEKAEEELGRPWFISGTVIEGDKRGRQIGFPTANIALGQHLEPARGVYAVTIARPDVANAPIWAGVANLGRRPTINDGRVSRLEVHVFDFDGDLYGQTLEVSFHTLLREERKFENFAALAAQIGRDAETARAFLTACGFPR